MGRNDKSMRLQAARDLLHLKGRHEPTFRKKIDLIIEILGMIHSPRNLSYCRREAAKLREQTPDTTPEQLTLFGVLDDRLFKKSELIARRQAGRQPGQPKLGRPPKRPATPAPSAPSAPPVDLMDLWASMSKPEERKP